MREKTQITLSNPELLTKAVVAGGLVLALATLGFNQAVGAYTGGGYGYGYGAPSGPAPVYRLFKSFNNKTADHFYTTSTAERDAAVAAGYALEGSSLQAYTSAPAGAVPIYRAFNSKTGDHFYTRDFAEYATSSVKSGYGLEGVGFYNFATVDDPAPGTLFYGPVYRLYSPKVADHFYTSSTAEQTAAVAAGYVQEGTGFASPQ